jgi:hypothetical protein
MQGARVVGSVGEFNDGATRSVIDLKYAGLQLEALCEIGEHRTDDVIEVERSLRLMNRRELLWVAGDNHRPAGGQSCKRQRRCGDVELGSLVNQDQIEELRRRPARSHEEAVGLLRGRADERQSLMLSQAALELLEGRTACGNIDALRNTLVNGLYCRPQAGGMHGWQCQRGCPAERRMYLQEHVIDRFIRRTCDEHSEVPPLKGGLVQRTKDDGAERTAFACPGRTPDEPQAVGERLLPCSPLASIEVIAMLAEPLLHS